MRQIQQMLIENFQSHARSELTFGPGLNVIIGPSDNGKSAVLRALRWALYNEPRGSEFVRAGARECRVTVTMSDGVQIVRELLLTRSGATSRSRYIVRQPGEGEQLFEGFGLEVPAEVVRAHGMPQVLLDTDKRVVLSLGSQLEGPFLLTESGSLRARALGRLLGVHVVDAAVRGTQRDLRSARLEVGRLEREVARYDDELTPYDDIPEQEARLARAEELLARVEQLQRQSSQLERLSADLRDRTRELAQLESFMTRLEGLNQAGEITSTLAEKSRRITQLQTMQTQLTDVEGRLAQAAGSVQAAEGELISALVQYEELLGRLGRCPTCLQPVEPDAIRKIVGELAGGAPSGHHH